MALIVKSVRDWRDWHGLKSGKRSLVIPLTSCLTHCGHLWPIADIDIMGHAVVSPFAVSVSRCGES